MFTVTNKNCTSIPYSIPILPRQNYEKNIYVAPVTAPASIVDVCESQPLYSFDTRFTNLKGTQNFVTDGTVARTIDVSHQQRMESELATRAAFINIRRDYLNSKRDYTK